MARFAGKRILITGGSSGIGFAGATRVVAEGGKVAVTGLRRDRVDQARRELPTESLVLANNAADPAAATTLAEAISGWGKLDGLWLNAGYADLNQVEQLDPAAFDRMMHANVRGPMLQLAALSGLLNDGASIVATSSIASYDGNAVTTLYGATKGALLPMVRGWATAFASRNIRANALVPGPIESNLRNFLPKADQLAFEASVVDDVLLGRLGTADEAAAVALFLLSDDSSYVTGSEYMVDGGFTLR